MTKTRTFISVLLITPATGVFVYRLVRIVWGTLTEIFIRREVPLQPGAFFCLFIFGVAVLGSLALSALWLLVLRPDLVQKLESWRPGVFPIFILIGVNLCGLFHLFALNESILSVVIRYPPDRFWMFASESLCCLGPLFVAARVHYRFSLARILALYTLCVLFVTSPFTVGSLLLRR